MASPAATRKTRLTVASRFFFLARFCLRNPTVILLAFFLCADFFPSRPLKKKTIRKKGGCTLCDRGDSFSDPALRCDRSFWADPLLCPGILPLDGSGRVSVQANAAATLAGGPAPAGPPPVLDISGAGFDPDPAGNAVELSSGGGSFTVVAASPSRLTLQFSAPPTSLGPLTARVTSFAGSFGGSSGEPVQVATVRARPAVSESTATTLASSATQLVISGSGFDDSENAAGSNAVAFVPAVANTVLAATATSLTVTFPPSSLPLPEGPLSVASVTSSGLASSSAGGAAVQVATVVPAPAVLLDQNLRIARNAPTLAISGSGFDVSDGGSRNAVSLGLGAAATVVSATATSLRLSLSIPSTSLGPLTAVVTSFGGGSGAARQVATVAAPPVVAESAAELPVAVSSSSPNPGSAPLLLVISGSGFDASSPAANTVSLSGGAAGTVTAATATALEVSLSAAPTAAGALRAVVTSFGGASGPGPGTQVATVVFQAPPTPPPPTPPATMAPPPPSGPPGGGGAGAAAAGERQRRCRAVAAGAAAAGAVALLASAAALALLVHPPLRASVAGYVPFSKQMRELRRARREQELLAARKRGAAPASAASAAASASAALASSGGSSSASALGSSLLAAPESAADGSGAGNYGSFGSGSWTSESGSGSGSFGLSPLATPMAAAAAAGGTGVALSRFDSAANNDARDSSSGIFAEVVRPLPAPRRSNGNPFSL